MPPEAVIIENKIPKLFKRKVKHIILAIVVFFCPLLICAQGDFDFDKEFEKTAQLIVMIQAGDEESPRFGAGIIFGREKDRLLIATAYHTLRNLQSPNIKVLLRNMQQDKYVPAKLLRFDQEEGGMDLAILSIESLQKHGIDPCTLPFDRLGKIRRIKRGDLVYAVGNPNGVSWAIPVVADKISQINREVIDFQSNFISKGHSGGGLLDASGNVIGMTVADAQPFGRAINLDTILKKARKWGYAVQLDTLLAGKRTPLHIAAMKGDLNELRYRLADCGNPNAADFHNAIPLHYAASRGNLEALSLLLKAGSDPNVLDGDGDLPVEWSIERKCFDCVDLLVKSGTKINSQNKKGQTLLHIAIDSNQKSIALLLIRSGINVNLKDELGNTALHVAVMRNQPEIVDALLQAKADINVLNQSYGRTPLGTAVADDNIIIAGKLLKAGAKTAPGSPLHTAVDKGFIEMIRLLKSFKADMNIESGEKTPLGLAIMEFDDHSYRDKPSNRIYDVKYPSLNIVKALIEEGANVNTRSDGYYSGDEKEPLLMIAIKRIRNADREVIGGEELVKLLIKTGARENLNFQDKDGNTPLLIILDGTYVQDKQLQFAKILLEAGADPNLKNKDGETALDGIEFDPKHQWMKNNVAALKLLLKAGAKVNAQNHLGRLPLIEAMYPLTTSKNLDFVTVLLEGGADPNLPEKDGETPMKRARYLRDDALLKLLARYGGK